MRNNTYSREARTSAFKDIPDDETEYVMYRLEDQKSLTAEVYQRLFMSESQGHPQERFDEEEEVFCDIPFETYQPYDPTDEDLDAMYREWGEESSCLR